VDAMNALTGKIVDIFIEDGRAVGKVRVGGAITNVSLMLLMNAKVHDRVVIESGIALSKVDEEKEFIDKF
jgi:hydrogenase maturation factor